MAGRARTEEQSENSTAATPNTTADDAAACFMEIQEINSAVARLGQKKASTFIRFENMGVDVDAVKDCLKLARDEDAPERVKRMVDMARILRIIPVEIDANGQSAASILINPGSATLSKAMDERLSLHRSFWSGRDIGLAGGERGENPHEAGTANYVDWDKGWSDGAEDLAMKKPNVEKAPTEVRERRAATRLPETALEKDEAAYREMAIT